MGIRGNSTWINYLKDKERDPGTSSALIENIPNHIWVACRIKAMAKGLKMNAVGIKLFEKWANDEVEIEDPH